jgi:membrane fusion protein, multidrug efflux system
MIDMATGATASGTASPPAPAFSEPTPSAPRRLFGHMLGLGALLAAMLVLYLCMTRWDAWIGSSRHQRTDNAYLQTDLTPLSARVQGYVRDVPAQDFQRVRRGELLVQLEDDDYRSALSQAEANAAVARAAIGNLRAQAALQEANVRVAAAGVASADAVLSRNARAARRQRRLLDGGAGSADQAEAADASALTAAAEVTRARAAQLAAERQLGVIGSQVVQARASLAAAEAAVVTARINLRHTGIRAPTDGILSQRQVRPGQYLPVGGQVASLAPLPRLWIIANYKETQLTRIRPGQMATFTVDAYPGATLRGHVVDYAPASGSQFALLPPDNATGNFTKIVQRIAVKVAVDDAAGLERLLRPGMSVVVDIDTGAG